MPFWVHLYQHPWYTQRWMFPLHKQENICSKKPFRFWQESPHQNSTYSNCQQPAASTYRFWQTNAVQILTYSLLQKKPPEGSGRTQHNKPPITASASEPAWDQSSMVEKLSIFVFETYTKDIKHRSQQHIFNIVWKICPSIIWNKNEQNHRDEKRVEENSGFMLWSQVQLNSNSLNWSVSSVCCSSSLEIILLSSTLYEKFVMLKIKLTISHAQDHTSFEV